MIQRLIDKFQGKPAVKRHKYWHKLRKLHLKKNPTCAMCGGTKKLQVHHIIPVHIMPSYEMMPGNLITLCRAKKYGVDCHLFVGHGGDFKNRIVYPKELIQTIHKMGFQRIRSES